MNPKLFKKSLLAVFLLTLIAFAVTGCQPQAAATEQLEGEHEMDHEHEHESDRLPNDGAVIRIISPADGTPFMKGEDIVIEVEVENFELSAEGSHWHLYVDGNTRSQVVGGGTKEVIHGLEPGEHHIETYLGLPTDEELEDGASIMITATE